MDATREPYGYTGNNPLNATDPSGLCEANASQATKVCQEFQLLGYFYSGIPAVYASVPGYLWEHSAIMQARPCLQNYDEWTCANMLFNPVYGLIDSSNRLIDDIKMGCDPVVNGLSVVSSASATVAAGLGGAGLAGKIGPGIKSVNLAEDIGAIGPGVGDLSFARSVKLAVDNPAVVNRDMTVQAFVGEYRQAQVLRELPSETLGGTVAEALKSGNSTVRKLLTDGRWAK